MFKKTITPEQKKTLLEFLEEHSELVKHKQTNQFTNADTARLWREVTVKLNAIPGAQKSWKEWRKVCVKICAIESHRVKSRHHRFCL